MKKIQISGVLLVAGLLSSATPSFAHGDSIVGLWHCWQNLNQDENYFTQRFYTDENGNGFDDLTFINDQTLPSLGAPQGILFSEYFGKWRKTGGNTYHRVATGEWGVRPPNSISGGPPSNQSGKLDVDCTYTMVNRNYLTLTATLTRSQITTPASGTTPPIYSPLDSLQAVGGCTRFTPNP